MFTRIATRKRPVTAEQIEQLKTLLRYAPSSVNSQPWHFIIASSEEGKARIAKATMVTAQTVNTILRRADIQTRVHGKDVLPMAGEYTGGVVRTFAQADAAAMWTDFRDLWQYVHPRSTTYGFMEEPLKNDEVWVAFDHTARLLSALTERPNDFVAFPVPSAAKGRGYMPVIVGLAFSTPMLEALEANPLLDTGGPAEPGEPERGRVRDEMLVARLVQHVARGQHVPILRHLLGHRDSRPD